MMISIVTSCVLQSVAVWKENEIYPHRERDEFWQKVLQGIYGFAPRSQGSSRFPKTLE